MAHVANILTQQGRLVLDKISQVGKMCSVSDDDLRVLITCVLITVFINDNKSIQLSFQ